jgi:hypothetical protein
VKGGRRRERRRWGLASGIPPVIIAGQGETLEVQARKMR